MNSCYITLDEGQIDFTKTQTRCEHRTTNFSKQLFFINYDGESRNIASREVHFFVSSKDFSCEKAFYSNKVVELKNKFLEWLLQYKQIDDTYTKEKLSELGFEMFEVE